MNTKNLYANSLVSAWEKVKGTFPYEYVIDENSSERSGYSIYRSNIERYNYICDLGDRLEVNLANGETVNIWILRDEHNGTNQCRQKGALTGDMRNN